MLAASCTGRLVFLVAARAAARAEEACALDPVKLCFDDDCGGFRNTENRDDSPGDTNFISLDQDE